VGKSTVCLSLLCALIHSGEFLPSDLAYIKPATQCESATLVLKFCQRHGIVFRGIGPIVYYSGFTYQAIEAESKDFQVDSLRAQIKASIETVSVGKKFVLVDGVGYPSVGSVAGISSAEIAGWLEIPVLHVGRPGVGNSIDAFNLYKAFYDKMNCQVVAVVFNKLSIDPGSRHSFDACVKYVSMYFAKHYPEILLIGFLPALAKVLKTKSHTMDNKCALRYTEEDLTLDEGEIEALEAIQAELVPRIDIKALLQKLES